MTDGKRRPASRHPLRRWTPASRLSTLLVTAATIASRLLRWLGADRTSGAGLSLLPDSSAKTKATRTTSPRLNPIIFGVLRIVPEPGQDGVRACRQGEQSVGVRPQIFSEPLFQSLQDVLPDRQIALRRRQAQPASRLGGHVDADARPLHGGFDRTAHRSFPWRGTLPHLLHGVNRAMVLKRSRR